MFWSDQVLLCFILLHLLLYDSSCPCGSHLLSHSTNLYQYARHDSCLYSFISESLARILAVSMKEARFVLSQFLGGIGDERGEVAIQQMMIIKRLNVVSGAGHRDRCGCAMACM